MSFTVKLAISLIVAIVAYTLSSILLSGGVQLTGDAYDVRLLIAFVLATATTALAIRDHGQIAEPTSTAIAAQAPAGSSHRPDQDRETGKVKWFNVSKGFGFIIKDDGEEIFVHFRSIRGEGRRSLRDGQRVSFVVAHSDKGPQADDVMAEDA